MHNRCCFGNILYPVTTCSQTSKYCEEHRNISLYKVCSDLQKLNHIVSPRLWSQVKERESKVVYSLVWTERTALRMKKKSTRKRIKDPISSLQEHDRGIKAIVKFNGACKFLFLPQFVTSWEVHPIGALRCPDECLRGSFRCTDVIPQHGSTGRQVPCESVVKPCYPV